MTEIRSTPTGLPQGWRIALWGSLLALLLAPLAAMQITSDVAWTPGDFIAAALMLIALGAGVELAFRITDGVTHRAALATASLAAFLTFWINGAVGLIGSEAQAINLAFYALVLAAVVASILAKFRPRAMAIITACMAVSQLAVGLLAELTGQPDWGPVLVMTALWALPAALYRAAAR